MEHLRHIAAHWPVKRPRILNIRVRRLTIGHWRLLEAIASPLITGGEATPPDALRALAILSLPWRRAMRLLTDPHALRFLTTIIASRLARRHPPEAIITATATYINQSLWTPDRYQPPADQGMPHLGEAQAATAPSLRAALQLSRLHLRPLLLRPVKHIFDIPADEALLWLLASAEIDGAEFQTAAESALFPPTAPETPSPETPSPGAPSPATPSPGVPCLGKE